MDRCGFQRPDEPSVMDRDESLGAGAWEDSAYELAEGCRIVGYCTERPRSMAACTSGGEGVRCTDDGKEGDPLESAAGRPKVEVDGYDRRTGSGGLEVKDCSDWDCPLEFSEDDRDRLQCAALMYVRTTVPSEVMEEISELDRSTT